MKGDAKWKVMYALSKVYCSRYTIFAIIEAGETRLIESDTPEEEQLLVRI